MSPEGRWYPALVVVLSLLFLAGGSLLMVTMLATVVGPFSLQLESSPSRPTELRVGIWLPRSAAASEDPLPRSAAASEDLLSRSARLAALLRGATSAELRAPVSADLASLVDDGVQLVVVSDASALTPDEQRALEIFATGGGRVLVSGWIGVRGPNGESRTTERMRALLGVDRIVELPRTVERALVVGGRTRLVAGLDPGQRIPVPASDPDSRGRPALPDAGDGWLWISEQPSVPPTGSVRTEPPGAGSSDGAEQIWGAAKLRRLGEGAVLWLSCLPLVSCGPAGSLEAPDAPADLAELTLPMDGAVSSLVENAVAALGGLPTHEVLPWPSGAPLAAFLRVEADAGLGIAHAVAKQVRARGGGLSLVAPAALLEADATAEAARALLRDGFELVARSDAAGPDPAAALQPEVVRSVVERARARLLALGARGFGFATPGGEADPELLRALSEAGSAFVLEGPDGSSRTPGLWTREVKPVWWGRREPEPVVRLPVTAVDPAARVVDLGADPDRLDARLRREARLGGLFQARERAEVLVRPEASAPLGRLLEGLQRRGAWCASAGEIARWWRLRGGIRTSLELQSPQRLVLRVSNEGDESFAGGVVRLYLPRAVGRISVQSTTALTRAPEVRHDPRLLWADLALPEIPPRVSRAYAIDLEDR